MSLSATPAFLNAALVVVWVADPGALTPMFFPAKSAKVLIGESLRVQIDRTT